MNPGTISSLPSPMKKPPPNLLKCLLRFSMVGSDVFPTESLSLFRGTCVRFSKVYISLGSFFSLMISMMFQQRAGRVATRTFQFGPPTGLEPNRWSPCLGKRRPVVILESGKTFCFFVFRNCKTYISQRKNMGSFRCLWGSAKNLPHVLF